MAASAQPRLSLAEWLVLCLVVEAPSHGFALALREATSVATA